MDVGSLLRRTGLSQAQFAALVGVTQPAVAQWVAGRRRPSGAARECLRRIEAAATGPTRTYPEHRGRSVELPGARWQVAIDVTRPVTLPNHLDWSPRAAARDLRDPAQRAGLYAQVLDEGTPFDVRVWVDADLLAEAWPDVPVSRHLRRPVADLVATIRADRGE